jgi:predicted GIY-YIG superfamily endonuclease
MHYVYLIRSSNHPQQTYIGLTDDIEARMRSHNEGANKHTSKYRPWDLITYTAFESRKKAAAFEKYLKHGSGHAFAKRHFW